MKFTEWATEITSLKDLTAKLLVDEEVLSETIEIKEHKLRVFLGDKVTYSLDNEEISGYNMRRLYSAKEKAWGSLLGNLKTKVTLAQSLNQKLLGSLVEPYIKDAVLERLSGNSDQLDNEEIILRAATKRRAKLEEMLPESPCNFRADFELPSPSMNFQLTVRFRFYNTKDVVYGDNGIKAKWSFLQNYSAIEASVSKFCKLITPVFEMICKRGVICQLRDWK